jgi:hypothetical protein
VSDLIISRDDIFQMTRPAKSEELVNVVDVSSHRYDYEPTVEEIYTSTDAETINGNATVTVTIEYKEKPAKKSTVTIKIADKSGTHASVSVSSGTYYAWGAVLVLVNASALQQQYTIVITGYPLKLMGKDISSTSDATSINENGMLLYKYKDNYLIQSRTMAEKISAMLLDSYKTPRKDLSIQWRGNPALELTDIIETIVFNKGGLSATGIFCTIKQTLDFDGTLRATLGGRKTDGSVADDEYIIETLDQSYDQWQDTNDATNPQIQERI